MNRAGWRRRNWSRACGRAPVKRKLCFDSGATGVRRVEPETRLQVVYGEQLLSTCHANRTYVSTQGIPLCA